jgi:hypothetical protein
VVIRVEPRRKHLLPGFACPRAIGVLGMAFLAGCGATQSAASRPIPIASAAPSTPAAPSDLQVHVDGLSATATWNAPVGVTGLNGYKLYLDTQPALELDSNTHSHMWLFTIQGVVGV